MKIIGNTVGGNVLIEMEVAEYIGLGTVAKTLAQFAPQPIELKITGVKAPVSRKKTTRLPIAAVPGGKYCACGKRITGRGRYKYCSDKCATAAKAKQDRGYQAKAGADIPNPAMTDEERKVTRLEIIRQKAAAHA